MDTLAKLGRCPLAALALAGLADAQVFVDDQTAIPQGSPSNNSSTFEVDFGDVDLDGDFDAVFADGDTTNDQNRIWINLGGLQAGVIGTFADQTAARFPVLLDVTRDLDFGDIDGDGDLDVHTSNASGISNLGNRWWVNTGNAQGGTLGFFVDETATRWVGLGGSGSSIPPGQLVSGTFITWCGDSEFGDLDADGDLDVVHASYGPLFNGTAPTRMFLNDGDGHFTEFNPSGFQLTGVAISNGAPALWAEGTQSANTTDTSGAFADIASSPTDVDLGDVDGDFDLDLLHGSLNTAPRFFANRLAENGGALLSFRDTTGVALISGTSSGVGHYDQELGDLDGDHDLDILGVNWLVVGPSFTDTTLLGSGTGTFSPFEALVGSAIDDGAGDLLDHDQDGDLDAFVSSFGTPSRLYGGAGDGTLTLLVSGLQVTSLPANDAAACDVDGDGDTDVFTASAQGVRNQFWENVTVGNDVFAPVVALTEDPGAQIAAQGVLGLRAEVYDNATYFRTAESEALVRIDVDGFELPAVQATTSMGQVFRAEIPRHLVGSVVLTWQVTDHAGNTGTSNSVAYSSTHPSLFAIDYGIPSTDANGSTPTIDLLSLPIPGESLHFGLTGTANATYVLAYAPLSFFPFLLPGLGFINIEPSSANTSIIGLLDASGRALYSATLPAHLLAGQKVYLQSVTFGLLPPNTTTIGTSLGLEVTFQ